MDYQVKATCIFVAFCVIFIIGIALGNAVTSGNFRNAAIERGYAQYCPSTGYFAWKDEC